MSPPGKNAAAICSCQRGPELWADSLYMNYRGWASWVMKPCEQRDKSRIPGAEWIFSIRLVSNNQHTQAIGTVGDVHLGCVAHKALPLILKASQTIPKSKKSRFWPIHSLVVFLIGLELSGNLWFCRVSAVFKHDPCNFPLFWGVHVNQQDTGFCRCTLLGHPNGPWEIPLFLD